MFYFQCWSQLGSLFSFFSSVKTHEKKISQVFCFFPEEKNLQNEKKKRFFFWNGEKKSSKLFSNCENKWRKKKKSKNESRKDFFMNETEWKRFSILKSNFFFFFTLFHTWFKKQCKEQNKDYLLSLLLLYLSFLCLKPNEKKFPDECFNDKNWMMNCFRPLEENLHKFLHFFFPLWKHETSENNFSFLKII